MARICKCAGRPEGRRREHHEHRCECTCGCTKDTGGYAWCASCSFDEKCMKARNQIRVGVLGLPIFAEGS